MLPEIKILADTTDNTSMVEKATSIDHKDTQRAS